MSDLSTDLFDKETLEKEEETTDRTRYDYARVWIGRMA